jgi:4-amino-4-deoxy-L-arabinose transferase-like glycosyltransferase
VHSDAEITPPLSFVLSWLTTQVDLSAVWMRLPSLVAGGATIPMVYLVGLRTVGRRAALVAAALTTFAPFMIFYSGEARGYGIVVAFVLLSTLSMLAAAREGRTRSWIAYGAWSCAAVWTHYIAVFPLAAQVVWLLWTHPHTRRPAVLANAAAAVGFAPWFSGLVNDINSPTTKILSKLAPFNPDAVRLALEHWTIGYPSSAIGLRHLPGVAALVLLFAASSSCSPSLRPLRSARRW